MPNMEERAEQPAKKQRKAYMGRRALLALVLGKSPSTRKWLMVKMEQQIHVKEKARRDIQLLAKSLGVKLARLELR